MRPRMSGLGVSRRVKLQGETKSITIIILSGRSEESGRLRGLDKGAGDYMVKPYSISELVSWIKVQLWHNRAAVLEESLTFEDI